MCSSSSACTAVGGSLDGSGAFLTVAERWNGTNWTVQNTLNDAGFSQLSGVACPAAFVCLAVGVGVDASGALVTLGEAWDGTQWSPQPTANPQGTHGASLNSVSCKSASACMAVGQLIDFPGGNPRGTIAEIFDGATWRIVPTPNPAGAAGGASGLSGVSCTSPSACFAVGGAFEGNFSNPLGGTLAERWDGTSWSIQPTPTSGNPGAFLNAVSCTSPNACTAVGNNRDRQVMAERWDGTSWRIQPVPAPAGAPISFLTGVSCTSATACMAIGVVLDGTATNSLGTVAEQWNGTSWTLQPSPSSQSPGYGLGAVSCTSASACTAVGNTDTGLLAERWNGTTWSEQSAVTPPGTEGTGDFFSGVSCPSASACTATGLAFAPSGPSIVAERWDGTQWRVQPTPNIPAVFDMGGPAVSCPILTSCTSLGGYRNDGPAVTLAEQWNGDGPAAAAGNTPMDRSAINSPSSSPLSFEFPQTISSSFGLQSPTEAGRARQIQTLLGSRRSDLVER
jgi:hypothetical protein